MSTVLIVDDNVKIVDVLAEYLQAAGHRPLKAFDGDQAVRIALESRPDIALVDVMLPGIDGFELTRRLQDASIPVILVTARGDEVDRLVGLELGADDYITKPFSPREVVARVKTVLRRCAGGVSSEHPIHAGDLSIDPVRREVTVAGAPVDLTRTEFDLLLAMARQPGRVFTRLQLIEATSSDTFEGYERTVDAHVKNIRRKIGDTARSSRYIGTIFGVGYRFEEGTCADLR